MTVEVIRERGVRGQLPAGGTAGQVPVKQSAADYDVAWEDQSGGGGGPHAATHTEGGSDEITITPAQISGVLTDGQIPAGIARDAEVTAAINAAIAALVDAAPATLDTLNELAAALGDDANFAATMASELALKVDRALFDANTILAANVDNTPVAVTVAEDRLVGRLVGGSIAALTPTQVRTLLALVPDTDIPSLATFNAHTAATISVHGIPDTAQLYRVGGTDVAVADGGTGASTAAAARSNLGAAAQADLDAHLNDTVDAHDASAISVAPEGEITGTGLDTVQEVLSELMNRRTGGVSIFQRVRSAVEFYDDFLSGPTYESGEIGVLNWESTLVNSGNIQAPGLFEPPMPGLIRLNTATNVAGNAAIRLSPAMMLGGVSGSVEWRCTPSALNDGTDTFAAAFGFLKDTDPTATPTDGIYFIYDSALGTTWRARAVTGGTATTVDTGVTVAVSYRRFRIKKVADVAYFYIDRDDFDADPDHGLVATVTTNVPNGFEVLTVGAAIRKRTGTTARQLNLDYVAGRIEVTR
jgi:hypothetical protein